MVEKSTAPGLLFSGFCAAANGGWLSAAVVAAAVCDCGEAAGTGLAGAMRTMRVSRNGAMTRGGATSLALADAAFGEAGDGSEVTGAGETVAAPACAIGAWELPT